MRNLEVILSLSGTLLGFAVSLITVLVKYFNSVKAKRRAEQVIEIGKAVIPFIEKAETFAGYTGAEKKEYVLTKANQFALEKGFRYDAEQVSAKIEELVSLTKEVNKREKDKLSKDSRPKTFIIGNAPQKTE